MELLVDFTTVTPDGHVNGTPVGNTRLEVGDYVITGDLEGNRCAGFIVGMDEDIIVDLRYDSYTSANDG